MELKQFLVKAKLSSYSTGEEGEKRERGGKEFVYKEDGFEYRDLYYGEDPFIGEEVVWQDGVVSWGMNFYGQVTSSALPAGEIYEFLQNAMREIDEERPFRGPKSFSESDLEYRDSSEGTLESFRGVEKILYRNEDVYRLDYHGGSVKPE